MKAQDFTGGHLPVTLCRLDCNRP